MNSVHLCYYVERKGKFVQTFCKNLSVPLSQVNERRYWILQNGSIALGLTNKLSTYWFNRNVVRNYSLSDFPEEGKYQILGCSVIKIMKCIWKEEGLSINNQISIILEEEFNMSMNVFMQE
jgi:hypothetical protein